MIENHVKDTGEQTDSVLADVKALTNDHKAKLSNLDTEVGVLKLAIHSAGGASGTNAPAFKTKVPEPKPFSGGRNAKELENFLWDMSHYFKAVRTPDAEMVDLTSMFLSGDAKLWWRTRYEDDSRPRVQTWEAMMKELREQFLPTNTVWQARDNLHRLKQTGTVREYVKEFSSLMLDIKNMSDDDKMFNFMKGLQNWAQTELRRQGVKDLPAAMAAADALVDYKTNAAPTEKDKGKGKEGSKNNKWKNKKKVHHEGSTSSGSQTQHEKPAASKGKGCFICDGPHLAKNCTKKEKVNAVVVEEGSRPGNEPTRVNPLQLLNVIQREVQPAAVNGLMYVQILLNNVAIRAMVDTGATHNFVSDREVQRLGLSIVDDGSRIKAVNSDARPVGGVARDVSLKVGSWCGHTSFMAVPLDDFQVILGLEFFLKAQVSVMPHLQGLFIMDMPNPCFVPLSRTRSQTEMCSALQLKSGLKRGEMTYLAMILRKRNLWVCKCRVLLQSC